MLEKRPEWLDLEQFSDVALFNTKAVVQQTGIAAPTLRAWERRYMILSPERAGNDYRLYSERDIAIIRWLKAHVDTGLSISQSVALFHHLEQQEKREKNTSPASQSVAQRETGTITNSLSDLRSVQERLLVAFDELDELTANQLMAAVLAHHPVEQVCTELITPTLWEVGRRWESGSITVSIEHFASNFFQNLLANMFHSTTASKTKPLVIVCCAPGEAHAIAPLMLSLLLRRAGVRIAYLGQSIEIDGLLQTVKQLSPALLCVSVTMPAFLAAALEIGEKLEELPSPHPLYIVGGQAFEQPSAIINQFSATHLHGHLEIIVTRIKQMVLQSVADGS